MTQSHVSCVTMSELFEPSKFEVCIISLRRIMTVLAARADAVIDGKVLRT